MQDGLIASAVIADFAREVSEKTDIRGLKFVGETYRHWMDTEEIRAICRPIYEMRQQEIQRGMK